MANLYEIDYRLRVLEDYMCDPDTGELLDEDSFNAKFDEIQMALNEKIESSICFVKNLQADIEAERIKNRIDNYIRMKYTNEDGVVDTEGLNKFKMETPRMKLSYRKSDSVDVYDIDSLPKEYIKEKVEVSADKTALKKDIKSGKEINGAKIVTNLNMQVK